MSIEKWNHTQPVDETNELSNQTVKHFLYLYSKITLWPISFVVKIFSVKKLMTKLLEPWPPTQGKNRFLNINKNSKEHFSLKSGLLLPFSA